MFSLLLFALPQPCSAQITAHGEWTGSWSYSVTDYDQYGNVVGGYSASGQGTLYVDINASFGSGGFLGSAYVDWPYPVFLQEPWIVDTFGPTGASGEVSAGGPAGFDGFFDLAYQSIRPDGQIVTLGGFAVADFTGGIRYFPSPEGYQEFTSFQSGPQVLPEPSALVELAIGAVAVAAVIGIRVLRARRSRVRGIAAGGPERVRSDPAALAASQLAFEPTAG
jgi:hypothetical protein